MAVLVANEIGFAKVLHTVGGKSMFVRVLDVLSLSENLPCYSWKNWTPSASVSNRGYWFCSRSKEVRAAVLQALPHLEDSELVVILCADVPLIKLKLYNI